MSSKDIFFDVFFRVITQTATMLPTIGKDVSGYVVLGVVLNGTVSALEQLFQYNHHLFQVFFPKHSTSLRWC